MLSTQLAPALSRDQNRLTPTRSSAQPLKRPNRKNKASVDAAVFLSGNFSLPFTHLLSSRWIARPAGQAWPQQAFRTAGTALTPVTSRALLNTNRCSWLFCTPVSIFLALQASGFRVPFHHFQRPRLCQGISPLPLARHTLIFLLVIHLFLLLSWPPVFLIGISTSTF